MITFKFNFYSFRFFTKKRYKPEAIVIAAAEVKPAVTGTDMKSMIKPEKVHYLDFNN